jgi:hypothetical protein
MSIFRHTEIETLSNGTSLHGYCTLHFKTLVKIFGEPNGGGSDKSDISWVIVLQDERSDDERIDISWKKDIRHLFKRIEKLIFQCHIDINLTKGIGLQGPIFFFYYIKTQRRKARSHGSWYFFYYIKSQSRKVAKTRHKK